MGDLKLSTKIDNLYKQQQKIDEVTKEINKLEDKKSKLKGKYKEMETALLADMNKNEGLTAAAGKLAKVSITRQIVPKVDDWNKFYNYIARNRAFDLLQRRVSITAFKERLEANKKVAGVSAEKIRKVNLTKIK